MLSDGASRGHSGSPGGDGDGDGSDGDSHRNTIEKLKEAAEKLKNDKVKLRKEVSEKVKLVADLRKEHVRETEQLRKSKDAEILKLTKDLEQALKRENVLKRHLERVDKPPRTPGKSRKPASPGLSWLLKLVEEAAGQLRNDDIASDPGSRDAIFARYEGILSSHFCTLEEVIPALGFLFRRVVEGVVSPVMGPRKSIMQSMGQKMMSRKEVSTIFFNLIRPETQAVIIFLVHEHLDIRTSEDVEDVLDAFFSVVLGKCLEDASQVLFLKDLCEGWSTAGMPGDLPELIREKIDGEFYTRFEQVHDADGADPNDDDGVFLFLCHAVDHGLVEAKHFLEVYAPYLVRRDYASTRRGAKAMVGLCKLFHHVYAKIEQLPKGRDIEQDDQHGNQSRRRNLERRFDDLTAELCQSVSDLKIDHLLLKVESLRTAAGLPKVFSSPQRDVRRSPGYAAHSRGSSTCLDKDPQESTHASSSRLSFIVRRALIANRGEDEAGSSGIAIVPPVSSDSDTIPVVETRCVLSKKRVSPAPNPEVVVVDKAAGSDSDGCQHSSGIDKNARHAPSKDYGDGLPLSEEPAIADDVDVDAEVVAACYGVAGSQGLPAGGATKRHPSLPLGCGNPTTVDSSESSYDEDAWSGVADHQELLDVDGEGRRGLHLASGSSAVKKPRVLDVVVEQNEYPGEGEEDEVSCISVTSSGVVPDAANKVEARMLMEPLAVDADDAAGDATTAVSSVSDAGFVCAEDEDEDDCGDEAAKTSGENFPYRDGDARDDGVAESEASLEMPSSIHDYASRAAGDEESLVLPQDAAADAFVTSSAPVSVPVPAGGSHGSASNSNVTSDDEIAPTPARGKAVAGFRKARKNRGEIAVAAESQDRADDGASGRNPAAQGADDEVVPPLPACCRGLTKAGKPCKNKVSHGSGYCHLHKPK